MTGRDAWPALYEAGATLQQIADGSGAHRSTVQRELAARGVARRPRGKYERRFRSPWHPAAAQMRAAGWSWAAIGRAFGVSAQAVQQAVARQAP